MAGHDQKPAADAEEAGEGADDQADHHQADGDRRRDADGRIALRCARTQHGNANRDHCKREQEQKLVTGDKLAD
jgi:hypothetical protein